MLIAQLLINSGSLARKREELLFKNAYDIGPKCEAPSAHSLLYAWQVCTTKRLGKVAGVSLSPTAHVGASRLAPQKTLSLQRCLN